MYINTKVVTSLLTLKGAAIPDLARVTGIHTRTLSSWLYPANAAEAARDVLPLDLQIAVLAALGVKGDTLRSDIVHAWQIHEPFFGNIREICDPLETVVGAFGGKAEVSYVAQEADPVASLTPSAIYALRFEKFVATLKVTGSPLRLLRFDPAHVEGLHWMENGFGILLSASDYAKADQGALFPNDAKEMLAIADESAQWAALRKSMAGLKLPPESLARLLLMAQQGQAGYQGTTAMAQVSEDSILAPVPTDIPKSTANSLFIDP